VTRPDWTALAGDLDYGSDFGSGAQAVFARSAEHEALRDVVRGLLRDRADLAATRAAMSTELGYDPALWRALSAELGLAALGLPASCGGGGPGFTEVALVQEELGYALAGTPFLSSVVLAGSALAAAGGPEAAEYLAAIAGGELTGCLAWPDGGRAGTAELPVRAAASGGHWSLHGEVPLVLGSATADLVVVFAQADDGPALFAVRGSSAGLTRTPVAGLDLTRPAADLRFDGTPARLIGSPQAGPRALAETARRGEVALAAEMLGGARRCLDMSVGSAAIRTQFGRPIGSFQAIAHKCADMFTGVYYLRPAVYYAAWALGAGAADTDLVCSVAKAKAGDVFLGAATANVQVHGGIGYTWEHDAHLFLKRAAWSHPFLGSPEQHRALIAAQVLPPRTPERRPSGPGKVSD
jgi:alkylation response protein AidB-like acyl-CoA dehydrogenase